MAGYFLYINRKSAEVAWNHIPESASLIVTSDQLRKPQVYATDDSIDLKELPIINIVGGNLSLFNWFNPDASEVDAFLNDKTITCSFHPRSGNSFGLILYIPLKSEKEREWLANPQRKDVRILSHTFQGERITDINNTSSQSLFSYIIKDDFLIISQYGDLIEDVIRKTSLGLSDRSIKSKFQNGVVQSGFTIYALGDSWKSLLLKEGYDTNLDEFLRLFPENLDFHLNSKTNQSAVVFESGGTDRKGSYVANWMKGQKGTVFANPQYISQQTSMLLRIAGADEDRFRKNYRAWLGKNPSPADRRMSEILSQQKEVLAGLIGSELMLCRMEESNAISEGKILLARYENYEKIRPLLYLLAKRTTIDAQLAVDKFQGYEMFSVAIPELPAGMFGPVFSGFPQSYVTYVAPYLVFSNNAQTLRGYLSDFENQLTWDQSPDYDSLLHGGEQLAQLGMVVNLRKAGFGKSSVNPYMNFSKASSQSGNLLESLVLACRLEDNAAFPSLTLNSKKRRTSKETLNRTFLNVDVEWPVLYDSTVAGLLNPLDGSSEVLLTDASHTLFKINNEAKAKPEVLTRLDGNIVTEAYRTDFLNIGRQQRVLGTRNQLYVIDEDESGIITRLNATVPGAAPISSLYRTEGGRESGSRFLIHDVQDNTYVWEGIGQKPRLLASGSRFDRLQKPVVSLNQLGSSSYILTQQNGKVFLISESGQTLRGFPVDLLSNMVSPFTWSESSAGQPELSGVTAFGELIRIDRLGKVVYRRQLLRTESSNVFSTLYDANSLDWLMVRRSISKVAILDKKGEVLFEIVNLKPGFKVQYHFFGSDNRFISVKSGNYTSIFDLNGRLLGDKPIPSVRPVNVIYQAAFYKLLIFCQSPGKIQTWSIKLR